MLEEVEQKSWQFVRRKLICALWDYTVLHQGKSELALKGGKSVGF